jgi:DNA-binding CsgD family transcriptional regulator
VRALTARQREVLILAAAGCTSTQTGSRLGIRADTVARHLGEAYKVLGAQDRAHAVALAIFHGHITLAELAAIAGGSGVRAVEPPRTGSDGPQGAQEAAGGARDVRGAARAAQGRSGPRGEVAA